MTSLEEPNTLEYYFKYPHMPIFGMGVTKKYLKDNCLKPGKHCRRFHSVSLSDGPSQGVLCRWGPFKKCEKASETMWQ